MSLDVSLYCKCCGHPVFEANVTHNLTKMADKAGIYEACWRPEQTGATVAGDIIQQLRIGLVNLKGDRDYFQQFNPPNGWGHYDGFVAFVESYLAACEKNPELKINVWR